MSILCPGCYQDPCSHSTATCQLGGITSPQIGIHTQTDMELHAAGALRRQKARRGEGGLILTQADINDARTVIQSLKVNDQEAPCLQVFHSASVSDWNRAIDVISPPTQ